MFPLALLNASSPPSPPSPPVDLSLTLSLLHFDTDFTDSSIYANTFTVSGGSPSVSATQSKFGGKSLFCNNGSIKAPNSAQLHLGSSDFKFEFWLFVPSITGSSMGLFSKRSSGASDVEFYGYLDSSGQVQFSFSTDGAGTAPSVGSTTPIPTNQWVFVQIGRSGTATRISYDGVISGSGSISGGLFSGAADLLIGSLNPANGLPFNGYIDEFRLRLEPVSLVNFTPPTAAFTF